MRSLPVKEQFVVHVLKAFTDGDLTEPAGNLPSAGWKARPMGPTGSPVGSGGATVVRAVPNEAPVPVYTDPEDIPFGKPARRKKIYGLVATPKLAVQTKTKAEAEFWTKVWAKWYELKGWKVVGSVGLYFATKDGEKHAINLHEYDKETKERL